jgi:two-component system chemotaxis response regulator CheB
MQLHCAESPYAAFDVVAIAASLGGLNALSHVLAPLPADFPAAILVAQHLEPRYPSILAEILDRRTALPVAWARQGDRLRAGHVSIAPPDHHLLVMPDRTLALSQSPKVRFVRPSADMLFASVAATYQDRAIGIVLTGSGRDGAHGVEAIKKHGGRVLVQDAATASAFGMPGAAIGTRCKDFILPLRTIAPALVALVMVPGAAALLNVPLALDACR